MYDYDATTTIQTLTGLLPGMVADLHRRVQAQTERLRELEAAGLIYATEFWRKNRAGDPCLLVLLYPSKAGEPRRRDYIGSDPAKIEAAQAGIRRAVEFEDIKRQQDDLSNKLRRIGGLIDDAMHMAHSAIAKREARADIEAACR
jgi:hypothetical protein